MQIESYIVHQKNHTKRCGFSFSFRSQPGIQRKTDPPEQPEDAAVFKPADAQMIDHHRDHRKHFEYKGTDAVHNPYLTANKPA